MYDLPDDEVDENHLQNREKDHRGLFREDNLIETNLQVIYIRPNLKFKADETFTFKYRIVKKPTTPGDPNRTGRLVKSRSKGIVRVGCRPQLLR